jgi:hypothetical protein
MLKTTTIRIFLAEIDIGFLSGFFILISDRLYTSLVHYEANKKY